MDEFELLRSVFGPSEEERPQGEAPQPDGGLIIAPKDFDKFNTPSEIRKLFIDKAAKAIKEDMYGPGNIIKPDWKIEDEKGYQINRYVPPTASPTDLKIIEEEAQGLPDHIWDKFAQVPNIHIKEYVSQPIKSIDFDEKKNTANLLSIIESHITSVSHLIRDYHCDNLSIAPDVRKLLLETLKLITNQLPSILPGSLNNKPVDIYASIERRLCDINQIIKQNALYAESEPSKIRKLLLETLALIPTPLEIQFSKLCEEINSLTQFDGRLFERRHDIIKSDCLHGVKVNDDGSTTNWMDCHVGYAMMVMDFDQVNLNKIIYPLWAHLYERGIATPQEVMISPTYEYPSIMFKEVNINGWPARLISSYSCLHGGYILSLDLHAKGVRGNIREGEKMEIQY